MNSIRCQQTVLIALKIRVDLIGVHINSMHAINCVRKDLDQRLKYDEEAFNKKSNSIKEVEIEIAEILESLLKGEVQD